MHMCCKIAKFDVMFFIKCTLYNFSYYTKAYFWRYLSANTYQVVYSFLFHTSFFICNPSQDSRAPKICDPHIIWKPLVTKIQNNFGFMVTDLIYSPICKNISPPSKIMLILGWNAVNPIISASALFICN